MDEEELPEKITYNNDALVISTKDKSLVGSHEIHLTVKSGF
jgi:hypothetical protein